MLNYILVQVKFEKGIEILKIFKEQSSKTCILDDFAFYEAREKTIQEKKAKEQLSKEIVCTFTITHFIYFNPS
jgi:ribosomal protein S21